MIRTNLNFSEKVRKSMKRELLSLDEMEIRIHFDMVRSKYVEMYGESIFNKCVSCKGTGLFTDETSLGYSWDCNSYCSDCDGYGGKFIMGEVIFECNECKGEHRYEKIHCKKCQGSGYVDWVGNIINNQTRLLSSVNYQIDPYDTLKDYAVKENEFLEVVNDWYLQG